MSSIFVALVVIAAVSVVAWNTIPVFREKMRGWSTMAEAAIAGALPFVGSGIDAFQETNWREYINNDAWPYVITALAGWFIFKRVVTTTALGSKS
jgi:hypothetical protein